MSNSSINPLNIFGFVGIIGAALILLWVLPTPDHEANKKYTRNFKSIEKKTLLQKILAV